MSSRRAEVENAGRADGKRLLDARDIVRVEVVHCDRSKRCHCERDMVALNSEIFDLFFGDFLSFIKVMHLHRLPTSSPSAYNRFADFPTPRSLSPNTCRSWEKYLWQVNIA